MASVSDTEDGWGLLENATCSDEEQQQTPDLQSQFDALAQRTELLHAQVKLRDDAIQAFTHRLEAVKDNRERGVWRTHVSRLLAELQGRFFDLKKLVEDVESQSKDNKFSINALTDSVKSIEDKAKRLEGEINERLEQENTARIGIEGQIEEVYSRLDAAQVDKTDLQSQIRLNKGSIRSLENRVNALETNVEQVEWENSERLKRESHRVDDLGCQFESLKQEMNDRLDREAKDVRDSQVDVECLERDIRRVEEELLDLMDNRFEDLREALEANVKRLERENKDRMEKVERQNQALQAGLDHSQRFIEGLHNGIKDAFEQTDTEFDELERRVEILETMIRNGNSANSSITSTQENRLQHLEAWMNGLQSNCYANPNNPYLSVPYETAYFVPSYVNDPVPR